jgi:hypothetical protein
VSAALETGHFVYLEEGVPVSAVPGQ